MECNRDEAVRAKTIAEGKMEKKDYAGAKKFALKAQSLYPGLEGICQMLTTIDVYISAEIKISGEVDWYGVLGVNPTADDETVRKQYRKLALTLHPDKNKSVGADGAFKLLSEAWSLLSDKAKRLAYNQRRSSKGYQQKVQMHAGGPSAPPRANGYHSFSSKPASVPKAPNTTARAPPKTGPTSYRPRTDTFWTICHRCKMHYEYLKVYLNHVLLCPNCHEAFLASETSPPVSYPKTSNPAARQHRQGSSARNSSSTSCDPGSSTPGSVPSGQNSTTYADLQRDVPPRTAGNSSLDPSIAAKAANVVLQAQEKMKRERDYHTSGCFSRGETLHKMSRSGDYHFGANMAYQTALGNNGFGTASGTGSTQFGFEASRVGTHQKMKSFRELTPFEYRKMLMEKGRSAILKKLNEWKSKPETEAADVKKENVKGAKQEKERCAETKLDVDGNGEATDIKTSDEVKNFCTNASDQNREGPLAVSMNVPDPDFHDFDIDRSENSFGDNEVWAAYDDDDGMPRFYALINKVISRKPFKVKLSWLNSKTNSEFSPMDWVGSGFYKTCGEFRVGKYENSKLINSFSHKVKWSKGPRGTVHIFPKKGDVWALYKNWSPDWNEHTPDEVIHNYEMVLVLEDYNEEQGVSVAPLVKVAGFRTVFYPQGGPEKIRRIPKEEMFRFSHQVPKYMLTGEEAKDAPKDCHELDPAAIPTELL